MAQIKNIKKPGDLIRGASVGPAALDKDGNVVSLSVSPDDKGKVLSFDDDGLPILITPETDILDYMYSTDPSDLFGSMNSDLTVVSFSMVKIKKFICAYLRVKNDTGDPLSSPTIGNLKSDFLPNDLIELPSIVGNNFIFASGGCGHNGVITNGTTFTIQIIYVIK